MMNKGKNQNILIKTHSFNKYLLKLTMSQALFNMATPQRYIMNLSLLREKYHEITLNVQLIH